VRLLLTPSVSIDWGDPALRLTEQQRGAMRHDREMLVTAGAGAGKTHTASLRYVSLLLEVARQGEVAPHSVLFLTFTERAADEMAQRCHGRLRELVQAVAAQRGGLDGQPGPAGRPLGVHLHRQLSSVLEHFDAASIGTIHGFCARLLATFPAATGAGLRAVVLDELRSTRTRRQAIDAAVRHVLAERASDIAPLLDGFGTRSGLIRGAQLALERFGALGPALAEHAAGAVAVSVHDLPLTADQAGAWLQTVGRPTLAAIDTLTRPGGGSPWVVGLLRPLLRRLARATDDPLEIFDRYRATTAVVLRDGALRTLSHASVVGRSADWGDPRRFRAARAALDTLGARCADWPERAWQALLLPIPADIAALSSLSAFSRLVLDAHERHTELLAKASAVDFSTLQRMAATAVEHDPHLRAQLADRHRYVMVDEFQDTDARQWGLLRALGRPTGHPADRLFLVGDVKQAIYGFRGGDVAVVREAASVVGQPWVLPHNFRSQPELVHWCNAVFGRFLAPKSGDPEPWEVTYEPMVAGRDQEGGSVSLLWVEDGHDEALCTAMWVARRLGEWPVTAEPTVAVLCRTRARIAAVAAALTAVAVPHVVAQGSGFWARAEVVDLVNLLEALALGDPIATVGALRGPLFGWTDQEVLTLVRSVPAGEALEGPHRVDYAGSSTLIREGLQAWAGWVERSREGTPAGLIGALSDAMSGALWQRGGAVALANARALAERAAALEPAGLGEVAGLFGEAVRNGVRTSEAAIPRTDARVVLLTVHAAKGLEFPVVVIPGMDDLPPAVSDPLVVARDGGRWDMATRVLDPVAEVQQPVRPGRLERLIRRRQAEQDAEYARLFYVAATRAEQHLLLVSRRPPAVRRRRRQSWMDRLEPILPEATQVFRSGALGPRPDPAPPTTEPRLDPPAPPSLASRPVRIAVSGLATYQACPARWYRRHRLGQPEPVVAPAAQTLAALRGQVLHGLIEDGVFEPGVARRRWAAVLGAQRAPKALRVLLRHLEATACSEQAQRLLALPAQSEVGVARSWAGIELFGRIDRVVDAGEHRVLVDVKTGKGGGEAARLQLSAYLWASAALGPAPPTLLAVLRTAKGRVEDVEVLPSQDVEALLSQVEAVAKGGWEAVLAQAAVASPDCEGCPFHGHGCPGVTDPTDAAEVC
jgi:ATP-dependent helicase/nuclease subunit A